MKRPRPVLPLAVLLACSVACAQVANPPSTYVRLTGGTSAPASGTTTTVRVGAGTVTITTAGGLAARFSYTGPADDTVSAARALIATDPDLDSPISSADAREIAGAFDQARAVLLGRGPSPVGFVEGLDLTLDWTRERLSFTVAPHEYPAFGADRHVLGTGGPVIREFSDFQCPYCRTLHDEVLPVLQRDLVNKGLARFSYRQFPLDVHKNAMPLALGSECAAQQGKFWPYHDAAFASTDPLAAARQVGLNTAAFQACVQDPKVQALVNADLRAGQAVEVSGTPSLYVGPFKVQDWANADLIARYVRLAAALRK